MTVSVGDCLEVMAALPADSVDAIVTDPPYGLGFMGHEWDQPGRFGPITANGEPGLDDRVVPRPRRRQSQPDPATGAGHARERKLLGGPTGRDNRTHTLRGGAMHAGRYDLSLQANWRFQEWVEAWAREALRILKPGGYLLASGGTRTYHRLTSGIEDAGFEIRDSVVWLYGSGFPKSRDVSKAIDEAAGADGSWRQEDHPGRAGARTATTSIIGQGHHASPDNPEGLRHIYEAETPDAERWAGWGTALKPAHEPIVVARKPLIGTVHANVLEHGTGALNIDGCRIGFADDLDEREAKDKNRHADFDSGARENRGIYGVDERPRTTYDAPGRWPANVALDPEAAAMLDEQTGELASRFFYVAKASRAERNAGLDGFAERPASKMGAGIRSSIGRPCEGTTSSEDRTARNDHPTVKPIALMRWLARLVIQPGGLILDPFAGSGTTGIAAALEGFRFHGIEREPAYARIADARIAFWAEHGEEALRIVAEQERAETARELVREAGQLELLG